MRITAIRSYAIAAALDVPLTDTNQYRKSQNAVLVEIETDTGPTGIGESGWFGGPPQTTKRVIDEELAPLLIGEDPCFVERLWQKLYSATYYHGRHGLIMSAMSGLDIALWDILGKHVRAPLYEIFGGMATKIPAYASAGSYDRTPDPESLAQELKGWVDSGFKGVKMRIGRLPLSRDLERVAAVREAVGDEVNIMVDANGKLSPKAAIRLARLLEAYNVYWIEEPTDPDNPDWSAEVRANTLIPVAGYELVLGIDRFREMLMKNSVDIVQADAVWAGGISECRKIATLAGAWGKPFVPHVHSTGVALAANLHIVGSIKNHAMVEIDQENVTMMRDIISPRIDQITSDSCISVPSGHGLGIELNHEVVDRLVV